MGASTARVRLQGFGARQRAAASALVILVCISITGCSPSQRGPDEVEGQMKLGIRWQRLVDDKGQTCDRCGGTQEEVQRAAEMLGAALHPLGIEVELEQVGLTSEECAKDIMQSNRIWIADRPLEEWLGAEVGASLCGSCCSQLGDTVDCRTLSVAGKTYETIPAELVVKAGLLAAAGIQEVPSAGACCPSGPAACQPGGKCCP